ncbi:MULTISPECIES: HAD family hydrolase [unclassified Lebetimonas]|uniref:HAD family hydrolase n=1 Tax=unclassified Lebetimonas TaxID=2648158 RepID=UPI0004660AFC|nr:MULTISPECIES: HAD family hydrolase [unclassified Lebetimonas]
MKLEIQNVGNIEIKNIVFDFNGTIAKDGKIYKEVKDKIINLAENFNIYVLTSDTHGNAAKELQNLPVKLTILKTNNHTKEKEEFVKNLKNTFAVGNGSNDSLMLKAADIGVCVINEEGASSKSIINSDVICKSIIDAVNLLEKPKRIIATLRM